MTWHALTFTASHLLTASDMNRVQENFTALARGDAGAPAVSVNSLMVTGVASIANLHVAGTATLVGGGLPTGAVIPYAGTSAPVGWLLCTGQAVGRTTYAGLFALVGTTFGAGDGSTTFNLPDLRGRVVAALDNLGGSSANRITGAWADALGGAGGAEMHTLTAAEIAAHTHPSVQMRRESSINGGVGGVGTLADAGAKSSDTTITVDANTGGGGAHNNLQPSLALGYIIKT